MVTIATRRIRALACFLFLALFVASTPVQALPTGPEVLRKVEAARRGIRDYTVDVDIRVDAANMRIPDATIRLFFKHPDRTKVQAVKGFAILPRGSVFTGDPFGGLAGHFDARTQGKAVLAGRPVYHLTLEPKEGAGRENHGTMEAWVDAQRWLVLRVRHSRSAGQPFSLDVEYTRHQGSYWLPARSIARLNLPASQQDTQSPDTLKPGTVTAVFRDYRVNTGLPDSLFREESRPSSGGKRRRAH